VALLEVLTLPILGEGSQREAVEYDLGLLSPEELAQEFEVAKHILRNLCGAAEAINVVTLAVLSDCFEGAREAHRRARLAAGTEVHPFD
jgi:hypothetical protein